MSLLKTAAKRHQSGQSMTQYLILMFVMTLGSLTAFGQFGQKGQHQIALVAGEIAGKAGSALSSSGSGSAPTDTSNTGNQSNSPYSGAGTSSSTPNPTPPSGTANGNPVTNPTGSNTTPAVPSNPPPDTVANNPVTHPSNGGTTAPSNTSEAGNQTNGGSTDGQTAPTGQTSLGGGTTLPEPEEVQCETTWEDPAYTAGDCDGWVCEVTGNFYAKAKVAANTVIDFLKGIFEGMGDQLNDLWTLLKDPSVLLDIAEQFIDKPKETIEGIVAGVVGDAKKVMECGPADIGRVIGQNANPIVVLKIIGKLTPNKKLAEYIKKKEYEIDCLSFPAGTPIWTPNGKVSIESILKGSLVNSRDENNFSNNPQSVLALHSRTAQGYQRIKTEKGIIEVTQEHPFWVQGKGWVEAKDIEWEDPIATIDGDVISYQNDFIKEPVKVYNFSVDKTHNYFAGSFGAWVHNVDCDIPDIPNRQIGHVTAWSDMTKKQKRAFQHSYSRHAAELGLPTWRQGIAESLRFQFNAIVKKILESGKYLGVKKKPFNGQSTDVHFYEATIDGKKYYYYETLEGQFISAGLSR